jgi:hypothetical protein
MSLTLFIVSQNKALSKKATQKAMANSFESPLASIPIIPTFIPLPTATPIIPTSYSKLYPNSKIVPLTTSSPPSKMPKPMNTTALRIKL